MSTEPQHTPYQKPAVEFKSSTFSVPVLVLAVQDLTVIEHQLLQKIKQAPEFFKNSPLLLDLQELNKQQLDLDITLAIKLLRDLGLLPIGIRGGTAEQNEAALALNIPKLSVQSSPSQDTQQKSQKIMPEPEVVAEPEQEAQHVPTRIITQPVRSGQRLYVAGDLVVLAQVSAGAEIMAEGNIHVYSTLRGRALAGVQGDTEARIFCSDLQAELVSIAGNYKISEDLDESVRSKPVQIYLNDKALIIQDL
ncbi:MAG: septum site-determining protein MinC [Gammaproteobacteria bacterium]